MTMTPTDSAIMQPINGFMPSDGFNCPLGNIRILTLPFVSALILSAASFSRMQIGWVRGTLVEWAHRGPGITSPAQAWETLTATRMQ